MIGFSFRVSCLSLCVCLFGCAGLKQPKINAAVAGNQKQDFAVFITEPHGWRLYKIDDREVPDTEPTNWTLTNFPRGEHTIMMYECDDPYERYDPYKRRSSYGNQCRNIAFQFNAQLDLAYYLSSSGFDLSAYQRNEVDEAFSKEIPTYKKYVLPFTPVYPLKYWPMNGIVQFRNPDEIAQIRGEISANRVLQKSDAKAKLELRKINQPKIRTVGASVCQQTSETEYVYGWVESVGPEKIQIRVTNRSKQKEDLIIWDSPMNWDICG
jgi:hypothetical protein